MLSENLKTLRKARGLSQEELAGRLHVVRQTVSKWEKGLSVPDAELLVRLAEELDTTVTALLGPALPQEAEPDAVAAQLAAINEQADRPAVLYTTDHGDMLESHSMYAKGPAAYEEICHVPMILRGFGKGEIDTPVSHIDIAPTIWDFFGFENKPMMLQGESLLPLMEGERPASRDVFIEFGRYETDHDGFGGLRLSHGEQIPVGDVFPRLLVKGVGEPVLRNLLLPDREGQSGAEVVHPGGGGGPTCLLPYPEVGKPLWSLRLLVGLIGLLHLRLDVIEGAPLLVVGVDPLCQGGGQFCKRGVSLHTVAGKIRLRRGLPQQLRPVGQPVGPVVPEAHPDLRLRAVGFANDVRRHTVFMENFHQGTVIGTVDIITESQMFDLAFCSELNFTEMHVHIKNFGFR